jgi:hypothetical protein
MADVEIIFPDKVVGIKPFQLVNLAVTVIGAMVAGCLVLWKVRGQFCVPVGVWRVRGCVESVIAIVLV